MNARFLRRTAAVAAIASGVSAGLPAGAATLSGAGLSPGTYSFDTYFTPRYFGSGSYEGVLRINVSASGSISGIFRNLDSGGFHQVTGGENGGSVWLELTPEARIINAHVENGKIVGGVYAGVQPFDFVADPQAHPHL